MTQISIRDLTLSHSSLPLFEHANLYIEPGERICLIGRNGAGKSTLLRLLNGEIQPDSGGVEQASSLKVALLTQSIPDDIPGTVGEIVTQHLPEREEYWQDEARVGKILSTLNLNSERLYSSLSGGLKRLVLLATILVQDPDVLLLDEPTNHLDIDTIILFENLMLRLNKTIIFVTHDRSLLHHLATHIVEIDNGKLISWRGSYSDYLIHKENQLAAQTKANELFDKKLALEEQWLRQGIKARRTRNEGRVRQLKKLRSERAQRRNTVGTLWENSV
jgi:ATP-binding cassette subfamily F protein uup